MTPTQRRSGGFDLGGTLAFRLAGLGLGFASSVVILTVLTRGFGAAEYAAYALIASLVFLVPFADLGLGATIVNSVSDLRSGRATTVEAARHVSRARDTLMLVAVAMSAASVFALTQGWWKVALGVVGSVPGADVAAAFTVVCLGVGVPLGIGARALQGASMARASLKIALLGPTLLICLATVLAIAGAPPAYYFALPGASYLLVSITTYRIGLRTIGLRLLPPFKALAQTHQDSIRLAPTAAPFLVISIAFAVGFQSHRLLLAHFGSTADVAAYSLVAQFAGPVISLFSAASQNLWARYRAGLTAGSLKRTEFSRHLLVFAGLGVVGATILILAIGPLASVISGDVVTPTSLTIFSAGLYTFVFALHQPASMLLTDPRGLWTQAMLITAASIVAVGLIILLIPSLNAAAPYLGFAVCMLAIQTCPMTVVAFRRIRASR